MTELNERQLELYKYLVEEQYFHNYTTKISLMRDLDNLYHRSQENNSPQNSTAYRHLRADIEAINKSNAQYVVLSVKEGGKLKGYKLANRNDEIVRQADKLHKQAMRLLEKESALRRKVKNDGQVRIASEDSTREINSIVR